MATRRYYCEAAGGPPSRRPLSPAGAQWAAAGPRLYPPPRPSRPSPAWPRRGPAGGGPGAGAKPRNLKIKFRLRVDDSFQSATSEMSGRGNDVTVTVTVTGIRVPKPSAAMKTDSEFIQVKLNLNPA
jgi:hypothetical protein